MASTLAQLRASVRQEVGDEERITGTATGGSLTEVIDTSRLTQADDHWKGHKVFIKDTTDDLAPKGESRKIAASASATAKLIVEFPFSAAVASGDTYSIAVFSDAQIDAAINNALQMEVSKWLPEKTFENLAVSANLHRFAPTSANSIRWIDKIEYVDSALNQQIDYAGMWSWNSFLRKVEWTFFWNESKTLMMQIARDHAKLTTDASTVTVLPREEPLLTKLAAADLLLGLSEKELRNDFGNLKPKSWRRGDVSESYESAQEHFGEMRKGIINQMKELASAPVVGFYPRTGAPYSIENLNVNTFSDPDGKPAPQMFWQLR